MMKSNGGNRIRKGKGRNNMMNDDEQYGGISRPRSMLSMKGEEKFHEMRRPGSAISLPTSAAMAVMKNESHSGEKQMTVTVRTRPLSKKETRNGQHSVVKTYCEDNIVRISKQARHGAVLRSEMGAQHEYQFDAVFGPNSTQADVYDSTTKDIVQQTLHGVNCTVFAYGATGAGKTHTMLGSDSDPGIIPRAMIDIFKGIEYFRSEEDENVEWKVKLSYLEVYNETIYDLLTDKQRGLQPCEDPVDNTVKVLGLTEIEVNDTDQVLEYLQQGNARRRMESTAANEFSSRSHAVLQVIVQSTREEYISNRSRPRLHHRISKLSLIDLAGSERAAATQNRGARLREGANINKSLLALANCINALSSRGKRGQARVKYRDSKLTHLLKSSLEGDCRLAMIAAINPCNSVYEESHNTLKYANRAKAIKIRPSVNKRTTEDSEETMRIAELEAENQELRSRLSKASSQTPSPPPMAPPSTSSKKSGKVRSSILQQSMNENSTRNMNGSLPKPKTRRSRASIGVMPQNGSLQRRTSLSVQSLSDEWLREKAALEARIAALEIQNHTLATLAAGVFQQHGIQNKSPEDISRAINCAMEDALGVKVDELGMLKTTVEEQRRVIHQMDMDIDDDDDKMDTSFIPRKSSRRLSGSKRAWHDKIVDGESNIDDLEDSESIQMISEENNDQPLQRKSPAVLRAVEYASKRCRIPRRAKG